MSFCDATIQHIRQNEWGVSVAREQLLRKIGSEFEAILEQTPKDQLAHKLGVFATTAIPQLMGELRHTMEDLKTAQRWRDVFCTELETLETQMEINEALERAESPAPAIEAEVKQPDVTRSLKKSP